MRYVVCICVVLSVMNNRLWFTGHVCAFLHLSCFKKPQSSPSSGMLIPSSGSEKVTNGRQVLTPHEYLVMPFGLCNALAVFQTVVNEVLREFFEYFCIWVPRWHFNFLPRYWIPYSSCASSPPEATRKSTLRRGGEMLFTCKYFSFLGYIITANQIQMDPAKVSAVADWLHRFQDIQDTFSVESSGWESLPAPQRKVHHGAGTHCSRPLSAGWGWGGCVQRGHRSSVVPEVCQGQQDAPWCIFVTWVDTCRKKSYDVGNKALLAIKAALEVLVLRYWLEGAEQPFIVWADHKNLQYIRKAKRFNSRQARWNLFF